MALNTTTQPKVLKATNSLTRGWVEKGKGERLRGEKGRGEGKGRRGGEKGRGEGKVREKTKEIEE